MAKEACVSSQGRIPLQSEYFDAYSSNKQPNWDIGRPQSSFIQLADAGTFKNARVLDVGCGLGDNTRYIARTAKLVIGIDLVRNLRMKKCCNKGYNYSRSLKQLRWLMLVLIGHNIRM